MLSCMFSQFKHDPQPNLVLYVLRVEYQLMEAGGEEMLVGLKRKFSLSHFHENFRCRIFRNLVSTLDESVSL